jgi:DNA-binding NarL/FixJ family response regulator
MNKQAIIAECRNESCAYDDGASAALCPDEPVPAGRPDDKFIENTLVFDAGNDIFLTKREVEILQMIVSGQTNKQIAQHLSRSERTIEFHRNRLMRKAGAHNAAELVKIAMIAGLL